MRRDSGFESFNTTDDSRNLGPVSTSKDLPRDGLMVNPCDGSTIRPGEGELGLLGPKSPGAPPLPAGETSPSYTAGELQTSSRLLRHGYGTAHETLGCPAPDGASRIVFFARGAGCPDMASACDRYAPLAGIPLLRLKPQLVPSTTSPETTVSQMACAALHDSGYMTEAILSAMAPLGFPLGTIPHPAPPCARCMITDDGTFL